MLYRNVDRTVVYALFFKYKLALFFKYKLDFFVITFFYNHKIYYKTNMKEVKEEVKKDKILDEFYLILCP